MYHACYRLFIPVGGQQEQLVVLFVHEMCMQSPPQRLVRFLQTAQRPNISYILIVNNSITILSSSPSSISSYNTNGAQDSEYTYCSLYMLYVIRV